MLNACEIGRLLYPLQHPLSILNMCIIIFNARVKDIGEAVLPHEGVGENSYAFEDGVVEVLEAPHYF